jgi:hypothetical protein
VKKRKLWLIIASSAWVHRYYQSPNKNGLDPPKNGLNLADGHGRSSRKSLVCYTFGDTFFSKRVLIMANYRSTSRFSPFTIAGLLLRPVFVNKARGAVVVVAACSSGTPAPATGHDPSWTAACD